MTKMEIASHLGILSVVMASAKRGDEVFEKSIEAVREAQVIMYELARDEIIKELKGETECR